ncbi:MAG TPA: ROK family protein [Candidatus Limnocylindrales bacterium]|nr:ROK family protein [Candidatus Limnocylindrales bacterium]
MYVGIDIGGTKTLVASLDDNGVITEKIRFETPQDYDQELQEIKKSFESLAAKEFTAGGAGIPGAIDRVHHRALNFGNLSWTNLPIFTDLEKITNCPMVVENDAKLAGLSEAMLVKHEYNKVLYLTVSTGIGAALIENRKIVTATADLGGASIPIVYRGKVISLDNFISGKSIVKRYGKMACDIDDSATWDQICRDMASALVQLIAIMDPDLVVIGGSVGTQFPKYGDILIHYLKKYELPLFTIPPIREAGRPEEAVLFGCYDLAKEQFAHAYLG